jgi:L-lactate dehydrogenase (cytochrome)
MKVMTCIEDLRQEAGRKVPRAFSDFVEGGSYAEQTLAANCADLQRIKLRQRILIDGVAAAGAGADRALRHGAP